MRSDEHFTHDGRPESEDGQPTPEQQDAAEHPTVEHEQHESQRLESEHQPTEQHGAHPCCQHDHHGHAHAGGHGRGGRGFGHRHGFGHGHGFGRDHGHGRPHGHPTLARSIVKSARRIRHSGLTPEQLQHRIAATVSHADYMTTMRTLRRIGMDLRDER